MNRQGGLFGITRAARLIALELYGRPGKRGESVWECNLKEANSRGEWSFLTRSARRIFPRLAPGIYGSRYHGCSPALVDGSALHAPVSTDIRKRGRRGACLLEGTWLGAIPWVLGALPSGGGWPRGSLAAESVFSYRVCAKQSHRLRHPMIKGVSDSLSSRHFFMKREG